MSLEFLGGAALILVRGIVFRLAAGAVLTLSTAEGVPGDSLKAGIS